MRRVSAPAKAGRDGLTHQNDMLKRETGAHARGARILVLDDEPALAEMLSEVLRLLGHEPCVARGPSEGLGLLREQTFDLVFSDFRMPGMEGDEFYRRTVEFCPEMASRVVFVTGDTLCERRGDFLRTSGLLVVSKPFRFEAIGEVVEQALAKAGGLREDGSSVAGR